MYRSCSQDALTSNDASLPLFQQSEDAYRSSTSMLNSCSFDPLSTVTAPTLSSSPLSAKFSQSTNAPILETFPEKSKSVSPSVPFPFCTALNSFSLSHCNLAHALSALRNALSAVRKDIDFSVSPDTLNRIDGVVFIAHHTIHFALHLHEDPSAVTIEYRRMSGDSVSSANFWTAIQNSLQCKTSPDLSLNAFAHFAELPPLNDFEAPSLSSILDELEVTFANEESSLSSELCALSDAMSFSVALCRELWARRSLVASIVDALESVDISEVRAAMCVLSRLAENVTLILGDAELGRLCALLGHEKVVIRKCVVRLLATLAEATETEWRMDGLTRQCLLERLAVFGTEEREMAEEVNVVAEQMLGQPRRRVLMAK